MNKDKLMEIIIYACQKLIDEDGILLQIGAQEESINHRLAVYLENQFGDYKIDCEYNRNGHQTKYDLENKKFRPDIIIHKRTIEDNLVYIEVKTEDDGRGPDGIKQDIKKIENNQLKYNYKYGVFILLKNNLSFEIQIFPKP